MLLRARGKHGIDLKKSFVVGDKEADIFLARAVGARGILVKTGESKESEHADFIATNLTEAVNFIIDASKSARFSYLSRGVKGSRWG